MKKPPSPCLRCQDRYMNCHSECEKYKTYKAELQEYNDILNENRNEGKRAEDYLIDCRQNNKMRKMREYWK